MTVQAVMQGGKRMNRAEYETEPVYMQEDGQLNESYEDEEVLPDGIFKDEQGAYHWSYRMDMKDNAAPMIAIRKIFVGVSFGVGLFMAIISVFDGDFEVALKMFLMIGFGMSALFLVLGEIAWLILRAIHRNDYIFENIMMEDKVVVLQTEEEKEVSKKIALLSFLFAALSKSPGAAGAGLAAVANSEVESVYTDVKQVIGDRKHDSIKVNNTLLHNVVFVEPQQFDFVWNYLTSHCPNAKIRP